MAYTTINKSTDYFNTKLYTGNGSTQSINVGFQSDWTWLKSRTEAKNHILIDAVRGSDKDINTNRTNAENTDATRITGFDSDGFNLGNSTTTNTNGQNYVSWNWKANGTGSANTDGSINSTVSANTTSGFSIVTYTGTGSNATVGHNLGSAPKFIIVKKRSGAVSWAVQTSTGAGYEMNLDNTEAQSSTSNYWNSTDPTSSVFSIGTNGIVNESGATYVAYCFAEKTGYSKFGSYTGNGNADGTFVYTGFKPAFVIIKKTSSTQNWGMYDNKREPFNTNDAVLFPSLSNAETSSVNYALDFVSNGFKQRATGGQSNGSGETYIYMAFGQSLVGSNNVPCTAR